MSFASPYLLLALFAVPVAACSYWLVEHRRARRSAVWSNPELLPNLVQRPRHGLRHVPAILLLLGMTLLLVGFARPERTVGRVFGGSPTVVLAIDVSGSMAATDIRPTRIQAARQLATRFLAELPANDQVALVTFGNSVRIPLAPTTDRKLVLARLPKAVTPRAGTALGDAISDSVAVVVQTVGASQAGLIQPGVVLLLSDGTQTAGGTSPADAATTARSEGIPIDTVSIGTPQGSVTQLVKVDDFKATTQIPVPAAPAALQEIAQSSGGSAYVAGSTAQLAALPKQLSSVYSSLNAPVESGDRTEPLAADAGGAALVLILLGVVLSGVWFGRPA